MMCRKFWMVWCAGGTLLNVYCALHSARVDPTPWPSLAYAAGAGMCATATLVWFAAI